MKHNKIKMDISNKEPRNSKKENNLLIANARIFDGSSTIPEDLNSIYIDKGLIVEINKKVSRKSVPQIDAAGAIVMPGLIDAHVHLQSVPGSVYRKDTDEKLQQLRYHHLRAYLACGVTTVLDNAISASMLKEFNDYLNSGGIGPNIYALAPSIYPPGGYPSKDLLTPYWGPHCKPAANAEDVESLFREYEGLKNIVGVKTFIEHGMLGGDIWPIHSPEMRKIIVEQTAKRNLPLHIHALTPKDQITALEMGASTLAHPGFIKGSPSNEFINKMKENGTYLTTTLASTYEQLLIKFYPERLEDELFQLTVPKEELITATDPEAWEQMYFELLSLSPKWIPRFILKIILKLANKEKYSQSMVENVSKAILKMHNAGIPVVIGSDTANWPIFISFFHGPSTIREIEILGEAGMPPMDVLLSATKTSSEMMGIHNLIGSVEVGKRADLIVVREDPLKNLSALRKLIWTIKDGEARTPKEWMHA